MNRKEFFKDLGLLSAGICLGGTDSFAFSRSDFEKRLVPVGRELELEGYYVWCNSPIFDHEGKVHLFFSRWNSKKGMSGWVNGSEIAHAVADKPEGPYEVKGTVLEPRLGYWDATTCHNPAIHYVDNKYCLFYMGNSNGKTNTKRIGMAISDSLYGPWERTNEPVLLPGSEGEWDDHCTTNPAFVKYRDKYYLFYKSWNNKEYLNQKGAIRANRKYGLAIADHLLGPYEKSKANPVIDFSKYGNNAQMEDAFVWLENRQFNMIARDMGYINHENGLLMHSKNGLKWSKPEVAYRATKFYFQQEQAPKHLKKYGRFERPQLLLRDGKPVYLFTTTQGGKYKTSSPFIFKII